MLMVQYHNEIRLYLRPLKIDASLKPAFLYLINIYKLYCETPISKLKLRFFH